MLSSLISTSVVIKQKYETLHGIKCLHTVNNRFRNQAEAMFSLVLAYW